MSLVTTGQRIEIVRQLPQRLQRRCEGLDPVSLRLALEAMQVPEREILQCAPPPPLGLARSLWSSSTKYPAPNTYANCWQWLTPTQATAVGSNVTYWQDLSGSGTGPVFHSLTSFSAPPPQTGGVLNGAPGIVYPISSTFGNTTSGPAYTTFFNCTLIAVVSVIPPIGGLVAYSGLYDNDGANSFFLGLDATSTFWKFAMNNPVFPYGNCLSAAPFALNTPQIVTATFDGASHTGTIYVNGTSPSSSNTLNAPTLGSSSPVSFFGRTSAGAIECVPGVAGDGIIYTDVKSGSDFTDIHRYVGAEYGIAVP